MLEDHYPDVLCSLYDNIKRGLESHEINESAAHKIAMCTTEDIRITWGGTPIYIPMGMHYQNRKRNKKIISEFNGKNHLELCQRYKITIQWLYRILKKAKS